MQGKISTYNIDVLKNTLDTEIREFINTGQTYDYMPMPTITLGTVEAKMFINGTYNITWSATPSDAYKFISLYFLKTPNEVTTYENLITAYLPIEKNIYSWKVPYDFVPGNYYIKLVSSYQNVEITDITPTTIDIISAKVPKFKVIQPTGPTILLRDNIQLMYTISDNQYGHLNQFSLYYVDKNNPEIIVDMNKTILLPAVDGEYEDVTDFSIPWGVDDFRLIVSASSLLDGQDLSIYVPSVSNGSSSLYMHIDEPSILTYTSIGSNYTVTQNSPFSINWTAKKGLDGLGNLVDVFYSSDRKKGQWELLFKDYPMGINSTGNGYIGSVSDVKIPLTYMDNIATVKIEWMSSKTGQKYEFKKDITVNKAQDTINISEFILKHGNTIIKNGDTILVNDKLPISVSFGIDDVDHQIEPGTIQLSYTVSNSPDVDVKLLDVEYNENAYMYEGLLSEENVAKLGTIISSKIKIKYYNRIFEKEQGKIILYPITFKMKSIKKHEIKINGIYDSSNIKTKKIFYSEPYKLKYELIGDHFKDNKVDWNIKDSDEIEIKSGNLMKNSSVYNINFTPEDFTGSTSFEFNGYNEWNKENISTKYPISLVNKKLNITNSDKINGKTFYSILHRINAQQNYISIDLNYTYDLPNDYIINFKLLKLSTYIEPDGKFWIAKNRNTNKVIFNYNSSPKNYYDYYRDESEERGVVNKKVYNETNDKTPNFSDISVKFNLDNRKYDGTFIIYCMAYSYITGNTIQTYDNTEQFYIESIDI